MLHTGEIPRITAPIRDDRDVDGWALVARAQAGDRDAFGELATRYTPQVHRFLASRWGVQFADDYTSEVFMRAYVNLHRLQPTGASPAGWLVTIARNLALDTTRRYRRELLTAEFFDTEERWYAAGDPVAERVALWADVGAALAQLPKGQAWAVYDRHFQAKTIQEIARDRGTTEGAVKALIYRGTQALRRILGGRGGEDT